ncbi:MAG: T9SS type A sorting domain-containing protein [Bacteroidales bacterium]|nr:T9SS type A sorting domain-containing protein [Bacteroidales bacterium]
MRNNSVIVTIFINIALVLSTLHSNGQWVQGQGMDGGDIRCIKKLGNDLFAGSQYGGVFRSDDNGNTWSSKSKGLPGGISVVQMVSKDSAIFAGTGYWSKNAKGVFRSFDNGETWVPKNSGIHTSGGWADLDITGFAVMGSYLFTSTKYHGIYRSDDLGDTWVYASADTSMEYYQVYDIHAIGTYLFAATYNGGFFRSGDYGTTWSQLNLGLPDGRVVDGLASSGTDLYARTSHGFFWSPNYGDFWMSINSGISDPNGAYSGAITADGDTLFVSINSASMGPETYKSINGGISWTVIPAISGNTGSGRYVQALLKEGNNVYAGNIGNFGVSAEGGGIIRSTDSGATWNQGSTGLAALNGVAITSNGAQVFSGTRYYSGIYKTENAGNQWTKYLLPGTTQNYQVLSMMSRDTKLFAGIQSSGVYISSDSGQTWTPTGAISYPVYALAKNAAYIFAGTSNQGMRRSSNDGSTWTTINTGLTTTLQKTIRAVATYGTMVYAGTSNGVFKSLNDGTNWTAANGGTGSPGVSAIKSLVAKGDTLIAGSSTKGIIRSLDKGSTWSVMFTGTGTGSVVNALVLKGDTLIAGGEGGIYVSYDWGLSWGCLSQALPMISEVYTLHIFNDTLYAGMYGQSVWQTTLNLPPLAYEVTGESQYCEGSPGVPVGLSGSQPGVTYTLYKNSIAQVPTVAGTGSPISFGNQLSGIYKIEGSNINGTTTMNGTVTISMAPVLAVAVTIVPDANPVSPGDLATFTATPVNGGLMPSFQWFVNNTPTGADSVVFSYLPTNNDTVYCRLTSSEICTAGNPVRSNDLIIRVIPITLPLENITVANGDTLCFNALQTITVGGNGNTFTVQAGGSATMIAGQNIIYLPGTTADSGSYMLGYITMNGTYCTNPVNPVVYSPLQHVGLQTPVPETGISGNIRLYPNPATSSFTLELTGGETAGLTKLEIYSISGLKVFNKECNGVSKQSVSVSDLRPGVYFVHVTMGVGRETLKLIKL